MKLNGCIKLFRRELETEKELNDTEFRLWLLYRRIADWDRRHITLGVVKESLRQLKTLYLGKHWSIAKISLATNSLIRKGYLQRTPERRIKVINMGIFQETVQIAEQLLQLLEQGVQITEQHVQAIKQRDPRELERQRRKLAQNMRFPH